MLGLMLLLAAGAAAWSWNRFSLSSAAAANVAPPPKLSVPATTTAQTGAAKSEPALAAPPAPPRVTFVPPPVPEPSSAFPRPAQDWLEAQIELSRRFFSCGPIDGIGGAQTAAALRAFQESEGLPITGQLDPATREVLLLSSPIHTHHVVTPEELGGLQPLSPTWLGKSEQTVLAHETILELVAERHHAHPNYVRQLNPQVNWNEVRPGTVVLVPAIERGKPVAATAHVHIRLADRALQVRDTSGRLIAHFPVSIARKVDKRPVGELRVTVVVPDPNYTFNPEVFPESEEGRALGRKLILAPGPNNPVGVAWIGLNLPGYGIHGTPVPEQVGRTESHGCFRLANWDARTLLSLAWVGLRVFVDP
jgi:lipoprotein-anchoring transpeptidase ErfK/SrfK